MNICSTYLKLKKYLTYVTLTEFWKLNESCHISPETTEWWLWKRRGIRVVVDSRTFKCKGERNDHMLRYEQVFGNVIKAKESKCSGILMKRRGKVKGEQVITLKMAQQLKTKSTSAVPGQLFCRQCKAIFLLKTDSLYWWSR